MSNVLIGIIGVILFIGLALAGALFLGPRFQESTQNSQASALMSSLKQASDAAELRALDLGIATTPSTHVSFLTNGGYLKTAPTNPVPAARGSTGHQYSIHFNNNIFLDADPEPQYAARYVVAVVGPENDESARSLCEIISRTYGNPVMPNAMTDFADQNFPDPASPVGCMLARGVNGPWYIAYSRIRSDRGANDIPSGWTEGMR